MKSVIICVGVSSVVFSGMCLFFLVFIRLCECSWLFLLLILRQHLPETARVRQYLFYLLGIAVIFSFVGIRLYLLALVKCFHIFACTCRSLKLSESFIKCHLKWNSYPMAWLNTWFGRTWYYARYVHVVLPGGLICESRGLHQGFPFYPCLFETQGPCGSSSGRGMDCASDTFLARAMRSGLRVCCR